MRAYFMRHGRTTYNELQLCNDDPRDPAHLSQKGIEQAELVASKLRDVPFTRIYVSELPRTQQTAAIINRGRDLPVTVDARINDIRTGFNNRPVADYQAAIAHDPMHARPEGGETLLEHKARVRSFLEHLARTEHETVLVIAHEETLRAFAALLRGLSDRELLALEFRNCEFFSADF